MDGTFLAIGVIIIDDIVLPDGTTHMRTLGGGVTHAVMGMRVWTEAVGLVSMVGHDFSAENLAELTTRFDVRGLKTRPDRKTVRAWQLFEPDGLRREVFRTPEEQLVDMVPRLSDLPESYQQVAGVHLHCSPEEVDLWVPLLRQRDCRMILWEPWDPYCVPENEDRFRHFCPMLDVVSPNLIEGQTLTGFSDPVDVVRQLCDYGAPAAVLRMGAEGSLAADREGALVWIPAYPVDPIVDVTGAGNAYCGGFIVGMANTGNLQEAGWYGGVSASFALHQFGAVYGLAGLREEAEARLAWYRQGAASG